MKTPEEVVEAFDPEPTHDCHMYPMGECDDCWRIFIHRVQRDALEAAANKVENFDPSHDEFEAHGELVDECAKQIRALMPKPEEDGTAPQSAVQGEG